ncbi:MAG TPA: DUF1772 domain-containing protein [Xanthobacteraceae bacterium]|jgi:hypothetical protein|nr:DUF1772 domain-containing protein [Xanthobacteraceae bacterium]
MSGHLYGHLALAAAALFTGAAFYVSLCEQPARLLLDTRSALIEWQRSYKYGTLMQAPLTVLGAALGVIAYFLTWDWRWIVGALFILAPLPFTLFIIMPTNNLLRATSLEAADENTRGLIVQWGRLHLVRTVLGVIATLEFIWALN